MGPGFDSLGMAVDIWNEITVERAAEFSVVVTGIDSECIPCEVDPKTGESKHLLLQTLRRAFEYCGEVPMPPVKVSCVNNVPISSGFGSSSSVIVGGLIAGLVLCGKELNVGNDFLPGSDVNEELLQLANEIEGHPDNVAPAIYGGIQLCYNMETGPTAVMSRRIPCPDGMRLVVYVPCTAMRFGLGDDKTVAMRGLLGPTVTRAEAVFNIQRIALLVDSLHRNDLSYLVTACQDKLHQPVRAKAAFPHLDPMIAAALGAGAHGCFLSGAGPTVMAICSGASGDIFAQKSDERQEQVVAEAMRAAADALPEEHKKWGEGTFYICSPAQKGAHVVLAEPGFSDALKTFGSLSGVM